MKFLSGQDVLVIHAKIIDETGGSHGVRDLGLLISATARPQMKFGGKDMYRTVFDKAAALFESLAKNHAFVDGNKRTAFLSTVRFLFINGQNLSVKNNSIELFVIKVIVDRLDVKDVAKWLRAHSKKR